MDLRPDDLTSPEIAALLREHLRHMHTLSPPESVHALDLDGLRQSGITFWEHLVGHGGADRAEVLRCQGQGCGLR